MELWKQKVKKDWNNLKNYQKIQIFRQSKLINFIEFFKKKVDDILEGKIDDKNIQKDDE